MPSFAETAAAIASETVTKHVDEAFEKAQSPSEFMPYAAGRGVKRYEFTADSVNGNVQSRKKPGSNISFETLRRFSTQHEVSRACINLRKRQITGLDWDIVANEQDQTKLNETQAKEVKEFFKNIGGLGIGYRKFIDRYIEDLLVLDAVVEEKQFTRGGGLYNLIPIDAATIKLRVDESGGTPAPPDSAYVQVIRGTVTAEWTTDEMIYDMMNPRNDSPYGLAPLESLMIVVTSSLKAGMFNLAYLTDGNIPQGMFTMPDNWNPQQLKEFQEYFDAQMAGDETMTQRLKFMPKGDYIPSNKPSDMAFQEFNDWLLKVTCALFEVSPNEIGFTPKGGLGGKGFGENQSEVAERKGLMPLAQHIEEVFTKVIHEDLGFPDLKFQFTGLIEHDEKGVAEINEILIRTGQRTVNELRTDDGLAPIDGLDKPFYAGQVTFLDEESQNAKQEASAAIQSNIQSGTPEKEETLAETDEADKGTGKKPGETGKSVDRDPADRHVELVSELRTFRKYARNRFKANKSIRAFESNVLPDKIVNELNEQVQKAATEEDLNAIFREAMSDYQINFLADVDKLRKKISEVI